MNKSRAADIAGGLLGLAFLVFGLNFFFHFLPDSPPPRSQAAWAFINALGSTGYLAFIKVLEITGAVLVAIPMTRNYGLLVLGPIIVNILCYNIFIAGVKEVFSFPVLLVSLPAAFLLWADKEAFASLLIRRSASNKADTLPTPTPPAVEEEEM